MILKFAKIRKLKRGVLIIPFMTPRLSSYWLYFVTSTSYSLAVNLVNSMKVPIICDPNDLAEKLEIELIDFDKAIEYAFRKIEQNIVVSGWTDSLVSGVIDTSLSKFVQVPSYGCFTDIKKRKVKDTDKVLQNI